MRPLVSVPQIRKSLTSLEISAFNTPCRVCSLCSTGPHGLPLRSGPTPASFLSGKNNELLYGVSLLLKCNFAATADRQQKNQSQKHCIAEVAKRLLTDHTVTGIVGVEHLPGLKGAAWLMGFPRDSIGQSNLKHSRRKDSANCWSRCLVPPLRMLRPSIRLSQSFDGNVIAGDTSAQRLLGLVPRSVENWLDDGSA
ncbi:hypothetical protein [Pararhizobium sp. PWRC1-1]|uniref:hypothetical protein n=1 Tax=Pararhizobium sp. PWRC1-1 TaxID=2804566 RepID=UPI003CF8A15F